MASGSASRGREAAGGSPQLAAARTAPSLAGGADVEARAAASSRRPGPGRLHRVSAAHAVLGPDGPGRLRSRAPGVPTGTEGSASPRPALFWLSENPASKAEGDTRPPSWEESAARPPRVLRLQTAVLSGTGASACGDALDAQGPSSTQCLLCVEGSVPDTAILSSLQPVSRGGYPLASGMRNLKSREVSDFA